MTMHDIRRPKTKRKTDNQMTWQNHRNFRTHPSELHEIIFQTYHYL
jgi:hypothetical protein